MSVKKPSLGGDVVRLTVSKVITLCINMLTSMMLARFRSFEEYGTYSELLIVVSLTTSLLMLGLPNSINYFLSRAETQEERRRFLSIYYTLSTVLSALIGLVLVLALPLIEAYFHNPALRSFAYFLAVYPWTNIITSSVENVLVVYQKTHFLVVYRLITSFLLLLTVLVVQWCGWGFSAYLIVLALVSAALAISVYVICARLCDGLRFGWDSELIRKVFVFSIPMGLGAVVGTLNTEIDKLLIGYLMDTEQMAIYTNSAKELPLTIVASSITAVLLPRMTRMIKYRRTESAIRLWNTAVELALIVIALVVAGIVTYAEEVVTILSSAKYLPGVPVFRVYSLNLLLRCTYFGIVLQAYGETKKILQCSILSLILNVILNPLLYYLFGMIGPAIATFLAILLILLLQLHMTARVTEMPFSAVFPWKKAGLILLANAAFAAVFGILKKFLPLQLLIGEIAESLLLGAVWSAAYVAAMYTWIRRDWSELNREEAIEA